MSTLVEQSSAQMNLEATLVAIKDTWLLLGPGLFIESYRTTDTKFLRVIRPPLTGSHFLDIVPFTFKTTLLNAFAQADAVGVVHEIPFEIDVDGKTEIFSVSIATKHPAEDFSVVGYIVIIHRIETKAPSPSFW